VPLATALEEARVSIVATLSVAEAAKPWDAVVIGAGPAGATAARELARRGRRVLLVDRDNFPRFKVCGGCLNGHALGTLNTMGLGHLPRSLGGVSVTQVQLNAFGRRAVVAMPGGVSLSRNTLDAALIEEAIRAGTAFLPGTRAALGTLHPDCQTIGLRTASTTVTTTTSIAIIASGLQGEVASSSRIGAGVVLDHGHLPAGRVEMAVARGGYVGLVGVEDGRLDIAAAFDAAFVRDSGGLVEAAVHVLAEAGVAIPDGLNTAIWKGTPALTRRPLAIAGPRWFAIGDAAGYVEPFTGEGMAWALSSAAAVVPIAAGEWSDASIAQWQRVHARTIGPRQRNCRRIAWVLRSPRLCRTIIAALAVAPWLARPVVRSLHRPAVGGRL